MSNNLLKPEDFEAFVVRRKQAWRALAVQMSWEEKIAAIERMRNRDKALKAARANVMKAIRDLPFSE
jgi:hypothetical protein